MGDFKEFKITWNLPKFSRCIIIFSLIINGLRLKRQTAQKITCFFAKNRRFNVFFSSASSEQRGKRQKQPFGPRQTPSAKIEHVGVYFAKMGCKIEVEFTDIFGFQVRYFMFDRSGRWGRSFTFGLLIRFAAKRKRLQDTVSKSVSEIGQ